jgi:hypothetical protein
MEREEEGKKPNKTCRRGSAGTCIDSEYESADYTAKQRANGFDGLLPEMDGWMDGWMERLRKRSWQIAEYHR